MLTTNDVLKVAELGRLKVTDAEVQKFAEQLGGVLDYVRVLDEVDVSHVAPMAHAADVANVFREDVPVTSLPRAAALANAPKTDGQFFLVPQILEHA